MAEREFKILSPTAILGYGFPAASFMRGMDASPDLIAVDAGSVDPGPYYLGAGKPFTNRVGVKRDLYTILKEAVPRGIPVVIGSAGGSGAAPHVQWCREIIEEIAREENLVFKLGLISADIDPALICQRIGEGKVQALSGAAVLTDDVVGQCRYIVGQMGVEPIIEALRQRCDVVLAGRAYDPTAFCGAAGVAGV